MTKLPHKPQDPIGGFDFDEGLKSVQADQPLSGNRKNGSTSKTIKSTSGRFLLDTPRDRVGSFDPQLVKKHQTHMSNEIERKILSLYALGFSYSDISGHIEEIYGLNVSTATIRAVTDKIISKLKEWQNRPLESIYPFVWLDAIHYKVWEGTLSIQSYLHRAGP